jgi:hypothetical protein
VAALGFRAATAARPPIKVPNVGDFDAASALYADRFRLHNRALTSTQENHARAHSRRKRLIASYLCHRQRGNDVAVQRVAPECDAFDRGDARKPIASPIGDFHAAS